MYDCVLLESLAAKAAVMTQTKHLCLNIISLHRTKHSLNQQDTNKFNLSLPSSFSLSHEYTHFPSLFPHVLRCLRTDTTL